MGERLTRRPQLGVQQRHLQRGLRHLMSVDRAQDVGNIGCRQLLTSEQARHEVLRDNLLRAVDVLGRVRGLLAGHTLTPALAL